MKATIEQAERNERNLSIRQTGYGHWKIECDFKGSRISATTTNSMAIDDYRSELGELGLDRCNRVLQGYKDLCEEIIRKNQH